VFQVKPLEGGHTRTLHRNLLLPIQTRVQDAAERQITETAEMQRTDPEPSSQIAPESEDEELVVLDVADGQLQPAANTDASSQYHDEVESVMSESESESIAAATDTDDELDTADSQLPPAAITDALNQYSDEEAAAVPITEPKAKDDELGAQQDSTVAPVSDIEAQGAHNKVLTEGACSDALPDMPVGENERSLPDSSNGHEPSSQDIQSEEAVPVPVTAPKPIPAQRKSNRARGPPDRLTYASQVTTFERPEWVQNFAQFIQACPELVNKPDALHTVLNFLKY
jgi:hypothetical protein